MKRLILSTVCILLCATGLWAQTLVDGIYYNFDESTQTASVTNKSGGYSSGSNSYSGSITIPSTVAYNGTSYSVTSIGDYAFYSCSVLTSITIPNSVTSIGNSTFYRCDGLTNITIPNSVTSIGELAFCNCNDLTSINIPNSVTSIGDRAFDGCTGLTSVTIPNSVTSIGEQAFYGCTGLTSVTIPNSVTSIGGYAFHKCSGLTSITIPNSVTTIESNTFDGCTGLTSVTIPNSVTSIGGWAFQNCKGLTSINIPNSVTSIGTNAFYGCTGLTSVTIPNTVTSIENYAFSRCYGLTSVTIPNSVTSIGEQAFYGCTGLTSMTVEVTNPPYFSYDNIVSNYNIPLYVPAGSVDAYKAATEWKKFTNIQAIPATGEYMITWKNWDGRVIKTSEVSYGEVPVFNGEKPTRPDEAGYTFTFSGWSPTIAAASQNAEYTANYIQTATEAEKTTIENEGDISITITDNTALFTWPENASADTYTLTITRNDEVFCSLTFDGQGRLINLNFPNLRASAEGYRFTVTGLNSGTDYAYDLKAKNGATTVNEYTGEFRTSGVATAVPEAEESIVETARYDINGRPLNAPTKGVNIVKYSDGSFEKEFVK